MGLGRQDSGSDEGETRGAGESVEGGGGVDGGGRGCGRGGEVETGRGECVKKKD